MSDLDNDHNVPAIATAAAATTFVGRTRTFVARVDHAAEDAWHASATVRSRLMAFLLRLANAVYSATLSSGKTIWASRSSGDTDAARVRLLSDTVGGKMTMTIDEGDDALVPEVSPVSMPSPALRGPERTVMVSASDLAALHGDGHPASDAMPGSDPFAAAAAADTFATPVADPSGAVAADPFAATASTTPPAVAPPAFVPPPAAPHPAPVTAPPASAPGAFVHGTPGGLVGMHLNDLFEIVRFIAQGGMGEVYEGRNLASNEKVAIKVILPQYAADEQFMALFRREASALERIGHDSLVKYRTLAFDRTSRVHYLAIEYVNGPSMADILVGDPADPAMVRRVLKRLCTGLGAAHEAGVIHRDLSPDNLLLPDGRIERCKIIDFGIAKDTNPGEKSVVGEAFAGKFGYAAPEIFGKFKRAVGPWTDVYSLALVMIAYAKGSPLDMG